MIYNKIKESILKCISFDKKFKTLDLKPYVNGASTQDNIYIYTSW